jgi:hypothetical protein
LTKGQLAVAGGATASGDEGRGIDPNQGDSLVEVTLAGKGEALQLQKQSEDLGIEFNGHYLRRNSDGTVTSRFSPTRTSWRRWPRPATSSGPPSRGPTRGGSGSPT